MKKIQRKILNSYATYTVSSSNIISSNIVPSTFSSAAYNIYTDDNTQINSLKQNIEFKSDLIAFNLINNKELLNCLTETMEIISNNGIYFHADLDLIEDEGEEKFILVYYPLVKRKYTEITSIDSTSFSTFNHLYRTVIRNLYKYSISIRKSVVIDELYI
jgi:hypothetical protein